MRISENTLTMNEMEIEAAIAVRKAEFWAVVDDENGGERTNANHQQLEQILQDLRDSYD
tara:strand:+ start:93 stop:269 length:177 start_codon:yes stop_codon:yes gene_type:complete